MPYGSSEISEDLDNCRDALKKILEVVAENTTSAGERLLKITLIASKALNE